MIDPVTGMMVAGGAQVAGNIFSSLFGSSASKRQAEAIRYAAELARKTALELNDRAREDVAPFRGFGVRAGNSLMDLLLGGQSVDDVLKESSLFRFESDLGRRDINRELAARGLYGSGRGLETLARFENELVAREGQRTFDRLFDLTQLGSNAAANMAQATTSTGNTLAQTISQAGVAEGNARAGIDLARANLFSGIGNTVAGGINSLVQYGLYQPVLNKFAGVGTEGEIRSEVDPRFSSRGFYAG